MFEGVRRLKDKESDRLSAIIEVITELGGKAEYKEGSLIIYGGCECKEAVLSSYNDHRMAMSAAIAAINHNKRIILDGTRKRGPNHIPISLPTTKNWEERQMISTLEILGLSIFGESHGKAVGFTLERLPEGKRYL